MVLCSSALCAVQPKATPRGPPSPLAAIFQGADNAGGSQRQPSGHSPCCGGGGRPGGHCQATAGRGRERLLPAGRTAARVCRGYQRVCKGWGGVQPTTTGAELCNAQRPAASGGANAGTSSESRSEILYLHTVKGTGLDVGIQESLVLPCLYPSTVEVQASCAYTLTNTFLSQSCTYF